MMKYPQSFSYTRPTPNGPTELSEVTFSTRLVLEKATELGITWREIPGTRLFELTYQGKKTFVRGQIPLSSHYIGCYACQDKSACRNILADAGIQTPHGFSIYKTDPKSVWKEVYDALRAPLVVKPSHGTQGQKVHMNVSDYATYEEAVQQCLQFSTEEFSSAIVEETFTGKEYRILTSHEKVIGITYRRPANVVGDGQSTIQQLIDKKNADPRRSPNPNDVLVTIKIDEHVQKYLELHHISLTDIPAAGETVQLRSNSNISTGGDSIDMTDQAHPSVIAIALKTIRAFPGLAFAGIDFMTTDITTEQTDDSYVVLELNESPGFSIHDFPYEGQSRNATMEFLYLLFPELKK